jgi:hypothetical protein
MRVETNTKLVKRNRQIAQYLFFFSFGVLIVGFLVTNQGATNSTSPTANLSLLLSSLVLPVGLVSTLISVRMTNLWVRQPRPETVIREGLKGLSNKSVLYNYYHIPARHVLICPQGVFAMVTRFQEGVYSVNGDEWKTHGGALSSFLRFMRRDSIGNPTRDAQEAAKYITKLFEQASVQVDVQPLIIFTDPRVRLGIENPVVPVLHADIKQKPNLKDYLRDIKKDNQVMLTPEQIQAFEKVSLPSK